MIESNEEQLNGRPSLEFKPLYKRVQISHRSDLIPYGCERSTAKLHYTPW